MLAVAAVSLQVLAACEGGSRTLLEGQPVHARDLAKLTIGSSSTQDVQRVLGPPDARTPDGALVYRATAVRRSRREVAGFSWEGATEVLGRRTATFRFANGVLAQVCRERS